MADRPKTTGGIKRFFEPAVRPSTPPWSNYDRTPETGYTNSFETHTWNEKEKFMDNNINNYVLKYNYNSPLTALSASPDHNMVAVAGREVQVLNVSEREITEEFDLKTRNVSRYSINDVKWGNSITKNKIATAATNGLIAIWDIGVDRSKIDRRISEHTRAVNRICFNPTNGSILLSASQDRTMKLWDLRESDPAKLTFEGKCENVRDVQFNSVNLNEFAAAFENGAIQKWDIRKPTIHERKLNAHIGSVLAVDWHSNGRILASGGRDKSIKIWDMNSDSRKPRDVIQTMTSISRIQWRPNYPDEIASCALLSDNRIFVWNITRPYIASYYFEEHEDVPTGFLWRDSNVLWSCSKDKFVIQQDIIKNSYCPLDLFSKCSIGWSIYDDIAFAIGKPKDLMAEDQSRSMPPSISRVRQRRISPSIIETRNEIKQNTGIATLNTFDYQAFSYLAENYMILNHDILSVCEHNAKIAWDTGRFRTSQTWKIIQLLYGNLEDMNSHDEVLEDEKDPPPINQPKLLVDETQEQDLTKESNVTEKTEKIPEDIDDEESVDDSDEELPQEDRVKDSIIQQPRRTTIKTIKMTSNIVKTKYNSTLSRDLDKESTMTQLLDYYAEQGDVQMCVTMVLVLGDRIKTNQSRVEQWFFSYIELLHRFQLWCEASNIISSCGVPTVEMMNQQSTTIYTACTRCSRPIRNFRGYCDKCRNSISSCSICHNAVKGLYTWCQGCSHGGHLVHMKEWFSKNTECPTGCGHNCSKFIS